jgi:glutaredoxin
MKNKKKLIIWLTIILIIAAVALINYWPSNSNSDIDEATMQCIAQNSQLYVSKTCPHCAQQKQILGDYLSLFEMIDCIDNQQACIEAGIEYVPTWVIRGERNTGVFELSELKAMTGC